MVHFAIFWLIELFYLNDNYVFPELSNSTWDIISVFTDF